MGEDIKNKKYSSNFERDYSWYLKYKDIFTFSGSIDTKIYIEGNNSVKECFFIYDSQGKLKGCNNNNLLKQIFKCKESINFQIKEWSIGRAEATLPKIEFDKIIKEYELLPWMIEAVEKQKFKHYKNIIIF